MVQLNREFVNGLTLEEKASLVTGHDFWFTATVPGVDKMMMTDGPSGLRKQADSSDALGLNDSVDAVCFPSSALTASSFDDDMLFKLGEHLGVAAKAERVGILLGPGVNIKRSPLAGRNFEYFSEDPLLAGRMATAYVKGVQSKGVGVSVKHFALNNRENQRFTNSSNVDERTMREIYLAQFERVVKEAHPATIMCSYNKINGTLNSQNQRLLTKILRDEWGFNGLVMSDWGAVADHVAALQAGLDLEMPGKGQPSVDEIVRAVKTGRLDEEVLNKGALRVLKMVEKWQTKGPIESYDKEAQHRFARQLADDSIVLLQNHNEELPIQAGTSLAVIGELAAKPRYQGGGSSHVNAHRVVTPRDAMPQNASYAQGYRLDSNTVDQRLTSEAVTLAKKSDQVIYFMGYPAEMESEGFDKTTIELPTNQEALLNELIKANQHVTVVLQNGSVVAMPWANQVNAIVETYLAGEAVGEATWDILTGEVNPSGKLSETFPIRLADNPTYPTFNSERGQENYHEGLFVGYRYYDSKEQPVRFPFGHGLSYTTFQYDHLIVTQQNNWANVEFTITNTGKVAGQEVAQVYVANQVSRVEKPAKELRDFVKVSLQPGESKTVKCLLGRRAFAWYNDEQRMWEADNGQYEIMIGSSVEDIRLQQTFDYQLGVDPLQNITPETYVVDVVNNQSPQIQRALEKTGLGKQLTAILQSDSAEIFENIPLRSLVMANIDPQVVRKFIELVNA
ncbi:glycoside hydrolase family 3 C-terminal domain-containing protein [uncultured Limosilactobacillus sp.]|uniref:glycoside hydrolase family 3 C-terminal domain-containing protein n=1 Tax=uncultured Limosilactobacillus sp. TaxID=2837629 RepID=UPI0025CD0BDC|nr:glycoside hydrolase family 3 C-terminal domain-containing protein [uncultured Limosilactobacillus sp.]